MLEVLSILYLLIPVLIFVLGWLKPVIAIPTAILLVGTWLAFVKNMTTKPMPQLQWKKTLPAVALVVVWVLWAGTGGVIWQNPWDHKFRNAIFMDLVNRSWPVMQDGNALCYYIGFWMPASLVGKVLGMEAGYIFQILWAGTGVMLTVFLLWKYLGVQKIRTVLLLLFYSGLDVLLFLAISVLKKRGASEILQLLYHGTHIELLTTYFCSSSNTTLLFWLYNQIVPFWVGFMLILNQRKNKGIFFVYALMIFFCPFPCVALIPAVLYMFVKEQILCNQKPTLCNALKTLLSWENIALIPYLLILVLYYGSNVAVNKMGIVPLNIRTVALFLAAFVAEYGIYLCFIFPKNKNDHLLRIMLITTVLCSFVVMGNSYDFAWRTCIPLAFYVMLLIAKMINCFSWKKISSVLLTVALLLGAVTPATEFLRTAHMEVQVLEGMQQARSDTLPTVFTRENNECYDNFIGSGESLFFSILCKD